ncbi:hypothetical protein LTR62_005730 [Meristemomyces frigidus]|uniref:Metallo-beta-lactamase domain-containing protein n=1 Tax=Meristemomyces frigidus TaxID=1508187 RepID=A0AAN7TCF0_9PEZI|nr:hypothetical protein LTR62_005730 [Meristemomyces frigidus]
MGDRSYLEQARDNAGKNDRAEALQVCNNPCMTEAQKRSCLRAWRMIDRRPKHSTQSQELGEYLDRQNRLVADGIRQSQLQTSSNIALSFTTTRISPTTWVIQEDDAFREHPLIYVKLYPEIPVVVLCDTGTDAPTEENKKVVGASTHLRAYLENTPINSNTDRPLNPDKHPYLIMQTHCHYDHTGGMAQFLRGGTTVFLASGAGRDFIESDFARNGLYDDPNHPAPHYKITHWAGAFERLHWPQPFDGKTHVDEDGDECTPTLSNYQTLTCTDADNEDLDLGITIIHTAGHTPDELAWYDHAEMHLYVGDSFYLEGDEDMPIIFPDAGNLIEWVISIRKLAVFVRSENEKAAAAAALLPQPSHLEEGIEDEWQHVPARVKISCAHTTTGVDGAEILAALEKFTYDVVSGKVPVARSEGEGRCVRDLWKMTEKTTMRMSILAPRKLMEEARGFFRYRSEREDEASYSLFTRI